MNFFRSSRRCLDKNSSLPFYQSLPLYSRPKNIPKNFHTMKKISEILTTMNALARSRGKDIKSEMKSPELSKYWCLVKALWFFERYSLRSSAIYTVNTEIIHFLNSLVKMKSNMYVGKSQELSEGYKVTIIIRRKCPNFLNSTTF